MATVEVRNLVKRFGKVIAVNKISFKVNDGEFFVLLGPSGCGKTTTLRCIAGLEDPDEGEILIDGKVVNDLPPYKRDIAMVFQNYALYPHMKVYDNLAFPLKMRGYSKDEIDRRVKAIAKLLHIADLLDRKPGELSGGQQQRVALGRALVREPKVFLMDEPLSNLDAKLRVYMRAELKKLQKELKITTIYVTHDQVEAMTMADRIAVMNKGKIMQIGTPKELYHKPANLFVAGFIGSPPMNFFEASLIEEKGKYYLDTGFAKIEIPSWMAENIRKETNEVIIGIRPEHIKIVGKDTPGSIKTNVFVVEPLGTETIINVKLGDKICKIRLLGETEYAPGETIHIMFPVDKMRIFNKHTESLII